MSKFLSKNLKSNSETSAFKKESVSKKKLSKKRGVSLIAVIIAIIVIIILAMIAYMNFNTSVDHANFARVSQDIASVEKQASIKRAENKIEYRMSLEKEQNRGFKKVYINNAPPEFVSFDAPGDLSGYLIDVDYVGENQLDIGRQKIPAITVTFGLDDAIIYDKTGKAFYLKGYYNDDQTLYHRVDVTANYPILEAPTITDVSYVLADDNKSATITVKAEPAYGGDLIVRLIEDNASAERISSNTYRMKVTKNGQYYVLVREKDKYYSSYPIEISGITQDVDTTPPVIDEMTYNQENYRSYIHVIAHDDESIITGYALTMSDETPTEWESYSLRSLSMDFDVYRTGTYYFWAKNENGLVSHELCGTEIVGQYTIRFNANGGSGGPVSQIKKENETLVLSSEMPTKSNSSFIGWAERADATSADYLPGGNYTKNGDRTLYAVWGGNIYRIIYNSNGGDEFDVVQEKEYGEDLIITTSVPTRSGFVFLGWSENITSTSPEYMSGGRYTKNANTTLYAVWSENTYTISYDANGGEGAPNSQTKRSSQDLVLSNTKPTRNGYDFLGWSENRLATAADYPAGGTYSENHDATLYAIWKLKSYTITYNANGGSGAPEDGEKLFGEDYVISSVIPTRDGHTFKGWNTSSTATNVLYTGGQSYTINDNLVLFAIWEKLKYTVSYDANGGSGAPASQTKYWGDALALSSTVPTYLGYTFLGWATSADATSATYEAGGQYTNNAGVVLYAVWERAEATFAIGTDFNRKIKTLSAGTSKAYADVDTLIKSVVWSDIAPTSSNMSEANIVSAEDSKVPIYAWYENNQIKLYTDALDIFANENASYMFSNLRAANSVDVSKIDFGRTKNMLGMFTYFASEASSLNLDLRSMDTSNTTNMGDMFNGAGPRGSEFNLDLSTWDTSKVTNMNSMFCATGNNSTAYKLNISSWDTSSVTNMRMMFAGAGAPSAEFKLDLTNWDVSKVTDMYDMFAYTGLYATRCEINVSNWDFDYIRNMFIMFTGAGANAPICIINASGWHMKAYNTVDMRSMFSGTGKDSTAVDINVSNWNIQNSIDMAYMFQGAATNASSFKVNATDWNVPNITNMSYMFYEAATNATTWKVDGISTWNTSKVTNMSGMFHKAGYNANNFALDLSSWNTPMVKSASGMFYYAGYNAKTFNLNLSNFKAINNTDLSAMFQYAGYNATSFNLNLANWNTVGANNMPIMFNYTGYNANELNLDLSSWDVSTVTIMDSMFENAGYNAKSVSINMANWNPLKLTRLNSIFKYTGYKANNFSINVSNWNTSNITMMYETFYGMGANAQLFNLDLRGWDTSKVRVMDNMFSYAKSINRIYVSDTFVTTSVTNSNEMFKDCLSIDGGSGTIYDSQHIDKEYARYDGRSELKGYFYDISIAQYLPGSEFNKAIKKMASGTNSTVSTTTSNTNVTEFRYVNEMPSNDILENAINVSVTPELPIYAWLDGGTVKLYSSSERIKLNRDCSKMFSFFRGLSQLNLIEDFGITESTSNVITMEKMMVDCSNLSEIDFSGVNTSNVTTMASMCDMCSSLSNINLSSFDTSNVTNMRSMFALCGSLSNVDVSHFNMKKVENVGSMFLASGITSLDLSAWDTSNIKIFADNYFDQTRPYQGAGMFDSCYKLTTLNLVGWDTSSATIMANMFYDCRNLERIYASESFVTTNVVHDEDMFYRCLSIKGGRGTVFNSSHIRKEYAHLDGGTANPGYFWRTPATTTFLPGTTFNSKIKTLAAGTNTTYNTQDTLIKGIVWLYTAPSSTNMAEANIVSTEDSEVPIYAWFEDEQIKLYTAATTIYANENASQMFYYLKKVENIDLTGIDTSNTTNMSQMFFGCENVTNLNLLSFNTSNVIYMQRMFAYCKKIEAFDLSSFNTSSVTRMGEMFRSCTRINELDLSNFDTHNVTEMASMFSSCESLRSLDVTSFDTSNVTSMCDMFSNCYRLTDLDLTHFDTSKVKDMSLMFIYDFGINSLDISNFDTSKVEDMSGMFAFAEHLEAVNAIENFDTSSLKRADSMFASWGVIEELDLSGWDTSKIESFAGTAVITGTDETRLYEGFGMFEDCTNLKILNLTGWDTSSATIMANMFRNCSSLQTIYASDTFVTTNVTESGTMFYGCYSIEGGRGTTYDENHIDKEYAHIDGGTANPGYFWNSEQINNRKTITYNSNTQSTFPGGETTNVVVYQANESTEETTRYSHTANIDDNGVQNGNYANNLRTKEVITIPGASSVHVSLTYGTERSYDYVYLFEGEFTGNVTNSLTGYIAKLDGGYTLPATVEYDVVGDTVTLAFYSDTSGVYYGYYATVSGTVDTFEYATLSGTYMTPNSPTNKIFIGWCESQNGNDNIYATEDEVLSNVENEGTVYAIYINSYVVTFNANGGNLGLVPATMSKIEGEDLILPSDTPTRDGYAFLGWATISTATVGQYAAGETYSIDADVELFAVWQYLNKTITFSSGSETTFPGGGTINTITYLGTKTIGTVSKVSHTTNINDDGVQNGNYADNLRTKDVITIPGASSVHVSITYGTESSYDLVYLFEGEYTGDVDRYLTGYVAKLNGRTNSPATVEYDVQGDTVTLAFYSDSSGAYYGYYATISGLSDTIVYTPLSGTYKEPNDITEKVFLGWCESQNGDGEIYATEDEVLLNVEDGKTLYAIFRIKSGTYLPGSDFSSKVKKIANQSNTGNDLLIKSFNWSNTMPTQAIINDTTGKYIVSTDDSDYPIYAWFDSTTGAINLWSESAEICLNADSSYMFTGLYGLIELNLYEDLNCTNTSNLRDMNHMFYSNAWISGYDTHLTSVDLRNIDTSNVEDMSSLFNCCEELLSVNFDGLDTSSVKDLSLMFNYCLKIPSIDMSSFDTSNVETFSGMFSWCQGLKSIDVTNFDTSSATNMKDMFEYCSALKALDVTHFDTSNVTNMYEMFALCENLLSLDVTNFDTSNVTDMQGMFRYCYKLTTIDVTRFDTSNVTTMAAMFSNCRSLTSLDVTHFDTTNVTSMGSMFSDCKVLPSIDVTHFDTTNVTNMASMFSECRALTAIDVTHFNTSNVTNMSGMFSYAVALNSLDVTGFDTRKVTNMSRMFESTGFQSIDVSTFITSEVTNMARMFGSCSYLTHLDVSNFDTSKVKSFGKMFEDSIALIDINVTGFNFSGVNHSTYSVSCYAYSYNEPNDHYYDIDATEMFSGCKALTHLDLSSWRNVSNVQSMLGMFEGCRALKTLNITSFDTSNLKKTPAMFRDCTNLERIYVSSDFVTTNITNSYQMFKNCNKIKGGAGTTYNESNIEMAYAHIDGGTSNPGYFTSP